MDERAREIEAFKTEIDLRVYAASLGYELHRRSSPNTPMMVGPSGDKIVIGRGRDGHYVYFSVHDGADSGSIIDFIQHRTGANLGEVRKVLRPFRDTGSSPPPSEFPKLVPIERDIVGVRARWEAMGALSGGHPYLCSERRIPPALIEDARFAARLRVDERGNAVFPHYDREGLCGFELVNDGFKGFAKSGAKGLWASTLQEGDQVLVFAESGVDALSYAALFGHAKTRFYSLAGQVSPAQLELAGLAIRKLPAGLVVLAFDNDEAGDVLVEKFQVVFGEVGRGDLELRVERPSDRGDDWNDVLREQFGPVSPSPGHG